VHGKKRRIFWIFTWKFRRQEITVGEIKAQYFFEVFKISNLVRKTFVYSFQSYWIQCHSYWIQCHFVWVETHKKHVANCWIQMITQKCNHKSIQVSYTMSYGSIRRTMLSFKKFLQCNYVVGPPCNENQKLVSCNLTLNLHISKKISCPYWIFLLEFERERAQLEREKQLHRSSLPRCARSMPNSRWKNISNYKIIIETG